MADKERILLTKALSTGEFTEVVARGIDEEHFADEECREVYGYAMDFMRTHKQPPSLSIIKQEFKGFGGKLSQDPLSYHLEDFVTEVKRRMSIDGMRELAAMIDDPDEVGEIEVRALEFARTLTEVIPAPRASRYSDKSRVDEYERRLKEGDQHGIYLGIPTIDAEMLGIQPHEFLVVAAYLGVGKSTMMEYICYNAYLQGKTSLYISLEMEAEALLRKLDTLASNFKYHALKAMELGVGDKETWERALERAHEDRHERDIIIRDDMKNTTVDHVMAETLRYKPDLVLVDYLELMSSPRSASTQHWEAISSTGIGLKQSARVLKIPHITAAQLNRDGGKGDVNLANVGHQSIGKHADVIIGLARDEEKEARQEMDVILLKNRDGKKCRCTMNWQMEYMILREQGKQERFPQRPGTKTKIKTKKSRNAEKKLEIHVERGEGETNMFSTRVKRSLPEEKQRADGKLSPREKRQEKMRARRKAKV